MGSNGTQLIRFQLGRLKKLLGQGESCGSERPWVDHEPGTKLGVDIRSRLGCHLALPGLSRPGLEWWKKVRNRGGRKNQETVDPG